MCEGPSHDMGWVVEAVASGHTPIDSAPPAQFAWTFLLFVPNPYPLLS
jgi:hypothetical protein